MSSSRELARQRLIIEIETGVAALEKNLAYRVEHPDAPRRPLDVVAVAWIKHLARSVAALAEADGIIVGQR